MQKVIIPMLLIIVALILWNLTSRDKPTADDTEPQLIWSDEFEKEGLPDPSKWSYDVGTACEKPAGCGWGNNELQYYTEGRMENARVEDGKLIIEAIKESYKEGRQYTSARLVSLGKGDWKYGRFEIRAKLPTGLGTWPAIWMLSSENAYGGWPHSGEIDIMEHVGYEPDTIYGTVHTKAYNGMIGTQKGGMSYQPDAEASFKDYVLEWNEDQIDWYINDQHYFTFRNDKTDFKAWPFDQKFHMIFNLAVGGNWAGKKGVDERIWPQRMEIEYVRVYKKRT